MREKDQKKIGLYIILINIIMILFLYTSKDLNDVIRVITIVSSILATLINYHYFILYKNKYNLVSLIVNIIITNLLVFNIILHII
jgi:hypothetical protein